MKTKRKFTRRFKTLLKIVCISFMILASIPMAIWTGDATGTVFLALIGIPTMCVGENEID